MAIFTNLTTEVQLHFTPDQPQIVKVNMDLLQQFEAAAVTSKTLPSKPSNDTLLKMYGLYKQATLGDASSDAPADQFDFVARAKYSSWCQLKGKATDKAMQEYIDLIAKLQS